MQPADAAGGGVPARAAAVDAVRAGRGRALAAVRAARPVDARRRRLLQRAHHAHAPAGQGNVNDTVQRP